jgi:hypothetical protein
MLGRSDLYTKRYVILHADDFGMCHSTNQAIVRLFEKRAITSTTLMANCPWSLEAAQAAVRLGLDTGVHLTTTSEWKSYKWGPVRHDGPVDTLIDEWGHFPPTVAAAAHADPDQLQAELTAQIRLAIRMGIDPTHLDNHMGSLHSRFELLAGLAAQFDLPLRFSHRAAVGIVGQERADALAQLLQDRGVLHPDEVISLPFSYADRADYAHVKKLTIELLRDVRPGVTELLFHPSLDTQELKAITDTWPYRRYEFDLFLDPDVQETIRSEGLEPIGWRELRALQRRR